MFRSAFTRVSTGLVSSMSNSSAYAVKSISLSLKSELFLPRFAAFSTSSLRKSSRNNDDNNNDKFGKEEKLEKDSSDKSEMTLDEESLLAEYYKSFKEDVWVASKDDDREVRWMEMLGERGVEGVFDLHELVDVLKAENVADIVCIKIPVEYNYTDYLVVGSSFSFRHLKSVMEYVKKLHKAKKWKRDPVAIIEGLDSEDWLVMDMGNVVLHLFLPEQREEWDLESLWTVGPKYDANFLEGRERIRNLEERSYGVNEDDFISWDLNSLASSTSSTNQSA